MVLTYRHIKWGLVSKLLQRVFSWHLDSRYTQVGFNLISVQVFLALDVIEIEVLGLN